MSSAVLGMVDQKGMKDIEVQIQGDVTHLILLVGIGIITKKGFARMIVIKTGITEIETGTDPVIRIAMNVTAVITKIGIGTVTIVIAKIEIQIIMEIEIMEDPGIETMIEIVIATGVMIETVTGTTTIKTVQDMAESGVDRGATQKTIAVMKLYTCSLFLLHDFKR